MFSSGQKVSVAAGSTSIFGVVGALVITLVQDDSFSEWFKTICEVSPKLPLVILILFLAVAIYFIIAFWTISKRNNSLTNNYEEEIKELSLVHKNKESEIETKKNKEIDELKNELSINYNKLKEEYDKFRTDHEHTVSKLKLELNQKSEKLDAIKDKLDEGVSIIPGQKWQHSVLIIDDDINLANSIKRKLNGTEYHVDTAQQITDYRFAAEYEIIISDVFDCANGEEATSILNTIKKKFPYKFVYAMSCQPAACAGLKVDGRIIQKDSKFQHEVVTIVEESAKQLDKIDNHWNNVERDLKLNKEGDEVIRNLKFFYYNFVKRMQSSL